MNANWTDIIKTVAPWIGTAIAGPLGGMAASAAASALGVPEATVDAVKTAITAGSVTTDQMLALKKADQDFQTAMQSMGFKQLTDLENIAAGDRKDARAMEISTKSLLPAILSIIITTGFLGLLTGLLTGWLHSEDNQAMLIMLGALGVAFGQVMNFWFGSTHESGRKTDIMASKVSP